MKRLAVLILVLATAFGLADPDRATDPVVNSGSFAPEVPGSR
jgi:hypothetical protein